MANLIYRELRAISYLFILNFQYLAAIPTIIESFRPNSFVYRSLRLG